MADYDKTSSKDIFVKYWFVIHKKAKKIVNLGSFNLQVILEWKKQVVTAVQRNTFNENNILFNSKIRRIYSRRLEAFADKNIDATILEFGFQMVD